MLSAIVVWTLEANVAENDINTVVCKLAAQLPFAYAHTAKNFTFPERFKNVAPVFAERFLWTSLQRTFVNYVL